MKTAIETESELPAKKIKVNTEVKNRISSRCSNLKKQSFLESKLYTDNKELQVKAFKNLIAFSTERSRLDPPPVPPSICPFPDPLPNPYPGKLPRLPHELPFEEAIVLRPVVYCALREDLLLENAQYQVFQTEGTTNGLQLNYPGSKSAFGNASSGTLASTNTGTSFNAFGFITPFQIPGINTKVGISVNSSVNCRFNTHLINNNSAFFPYVKALVDIMLFVDNTAYFSTDSWVVDIQEQQGGIHSDYSREIGNNQYLNLEVPASSQTRTATVYEMVTLVAENAGNGEAFISCSATWNPLAVEITGACKVLFGGRATT